MRVVCVSDTHGLHEDALAIPDGDVFVHAGDFTDTGERSESSFDRAFYPQFWHQYGHRQQYDPTEDQAVLIEGFLFYGTPWQPEFCNWAFNLPRGDDLLKKWRHIPTDTDVLITHTAPVGHGDLVGYQRVGCADLLREVETRVRPKLHVFGHVHEGYGRSASPDGAITYFNASICTHNYEPVNAPFVFELTGETSRVRVDGTTSGLLFESTLKLRPVDEREREKNKKMPRTWRLIATTVSQARERRNYGISRRVTVAVLDDIDEDKEGMDDRDREHVQQARVAAAALGKDTNQETAGDAARLDVRDRRSAVPMLASLSEEPSEGEEIPSSLSSAYCVSQGLRTFTPEVQPPPPAPVVEAPKEERERTQEKPGESRSRTDNPPPKRLSSNIEVAKYSTREVIDHQARVRVRGVALLPSLQPDNIRDHK
ncbi:Metallo-dependent phosphatase-like [Phytophthora cactorum]|nr:Metallo-dependent phosphatase-like [Phytophthora cactorum]